MSRSPIPVRPDYGSATRRDRGQALVRAVLCHAKAGLASPKPSLSLIEEIAQRDFRGDEQTLDLVTRAASTPATTTGWGSQLSPTLVDEFVGSLAEASGTAKLSSVAPRRSLSGRRSLMIPRWQGGARPPANVPFVAEGSPFPVQSGILDEIELGPVTTLGAIFVLSRRLFSQGNAEANLSLMLKEKIGASFDAGVLSATAGDAVRPPGLLVDCSPLTPDASENVSDAVLGDFDALDGDICDKGGSGENLVYVASPRQAKIARRRLGSTRPETVWASSALPDGTVMAVQTDACIFGYGFDPQITLSTEATLNMADPAEPLVDTTTAHPIFSLFQQDLVAVKVTMDVCWALRAPLVSVINDVSWARSPLSREVRPLTRQTKLSSEPSTITLRAT